MTLPARLNSLIEVARLRWQEAAVCKHPGPIRLAILRDLARGLHRARSETLAAPSVPASERSTQLREIEALETRLSELPSRRCFDEPIDSLLDLGVPPPPLSAERPQLPDSLLDRIPRERFDRPDRIWEKALARQCLSNGWNIWATEAKLNPTNVEEWQGRLIEGLGQDGVLLFAESAEPASGGQWHGRWYVAFSPSIDPSPSGFTLVYRCSPTGGTRCA